MPISNAAAAAAGTVAYKRIPHRLVKLMPGLHPILVRFAGFEGFTVPALELDGRKVQGSRRIARVLDEVSPDRPLFPLEPERRARVEEAERWGERVLQPVPRRLFRHLLLTNDAARLWMGTEMLHMPAPPVLAVLDFQILASVGVLRAFADLEHELRGRPCEAAARRLYPDWPSIPSGLPVSWC
jgi:glutathione S-transferase